MARTTAFTKRSLINKANSTMVVATSIAAFVVVFALFAGKSLLGQMAYQDRVIDAKKTAFTQLKADLDARDSLEQSYTDFVAENPNILGGAAEGANQKDGDNAKLILDALPSKYDFPALATSLEKMVNEQNLKIVDIGGTDDEVTQSKNQSSSNPQAVPMPFDVQASGSYVSVQILINNLLLSIRPFQILSLDLSGDEGNMTVRIDAQTFYQPEKNLNIETKVVK
jgi:hypothetical protein